MLDGVFGRPAPAAVGILRGQQPGDAALRRLAGHHIEVTISGQHAGRAVGRVFIVGGVLVAEPEGKPGTIRALGASKVVSA